jgi:integrase/recombinase XerD
MQRERDTEKSELDDRTLTAAALPPEFERALHIEPADLRQSIEQAIQAWLLRTPSARTRAEYRRDLVRFLRFSRIDADRLDELVLVRPEHVAAWRESLQGQGLANSTIRRKLTVLRSLFSYLQVYGYTGANPAHGKFVKAPAVPRDGKTVGLSPADCRRLIDAPDPRTPVGIRDRTIFAVLAYSACRVGELVRLKVSDFKTTGEHRVLSVLGKGGRERTVPLHIEAVERLKTWLDTAAIEADRDGALFRPTLTPRGGGRDGFRRSPLTVRGVEYLVARYIKLLKLDPAVSVHSFRVTALTNARERGSDIIDLQDFAGHADPRTTLTYIRSRDRLSKSPAYTLKY